MGAVYAILYNDGVLKVSDIQTACRVERWIPVYTIRTAREPALVQIVCFTKESEAKKFAKMNLPKDRAWIKGTAKICEPEQEWCKKQGWKIMVLAKAVKMVDRKDFTIQYESLEFQTEPEIYRNRKCES